MGEIHIVLLKTIIKDIEGVVRTLSIGANQNVAANPGGGHPHVVEGVSYPFQVSLLIILEIFLLFLLMFGMIQFLD